jgi:hypothetical protein
MMAVWLAIPHWKHIQSQQNLLGVVVLASHAIFALASFQVELAFRHARTFWK